MQLLAPLTLAAAHIPDALQHPLTCAAPSRQTLAPLALAVALAIPSLVIFILGNTRGWTAERLTTQTNITNAFYNNILFMAFLIYPNVSLISLQAFNCHPTLNVISTDFRELCPETTHWLAWYSVACIAIYPLGIPFLFWRMLKQNKVQEP